MTEFVNKSAEPVGADLSNLIRTLDHAKSLAHSIRVLENKIRLNGEEIREAEKELAAYQKKADAQNRFLRIVSSFWMALVMILIGIAVSVVVMVEVIYAILGGLVALGEFLLIIFLFLVLLFWNNPRVGLYAAIVVGILAALLILVYFVILVACLFGCFTLRNVMMNQAGKMIRECERHFPTVSTKIEQLQKERSKIEYQKEQEKQCLQAFCEKNVWLFRSIPGQMIREDVLSFLSSALKDGRAADIASAVALYERHSWLYPEVEIGGVDNSVVRKGGKGK